MLHHLRLSRKAVQYTLAVCTMALMIVLAEVLQQNSAACMAVLGPRLSLVVRVVAVVVDESLQASEG